ncbi:hypothetical protein BD309DRAFT_1022244 [Dichomitus squalens]|nr:hypothetical protein BD309DRAFT_1022244 [Dichomitus squalens]
MQQEGSQGSNIGLSWLRAPSVEVHSVPRDPSVEGPEGPEPSNPAASLLFSPDNPFDEAIGYIFSPDQGPEDKSQPVRIKFVPLFPSPQPSDTSIEVAREFYPARLTDSPLTQGPFIDNNGGLSGGFDGLQSSIATTQRNQSDRSDAKKTTENEPSGKAEPNVTDAPRYDPFANVPDVDIWPLYLQHALAQDKETIQAWDSNLDSILIFMTVLTTLVVETYKNLQPDPQVEMLRAILAQLQRNDAASSADITTPVPPFRLTASAVRVNIYWFSSLIISLSTALLTILAKQWVNYLLAGLSPVPSRGGRHRQYRIDGLQKWKLPAVLLLLPILLHIALLLFFAGLVDFIWALDGNVGAVAAALVITTFMVYVATNVLSYIYPECPFKTSVTAFIAVLHELSRVTYSRLVLHTKLAWIATSTIAASVLKSLLAGRVFDRSTVKRAISDLRDDVDHVVSRASRYITMRISSLRYQDEQYISQNTSLVDSRVLVWMVHHVSRLASPEQLGYALMRFPHLVRLRQLFMQEGALPFIERLLHKWFDAPWSELGSTHRRNVVATIRTLGMLLTEEEMDGLEHIEPTVPDGTLTDRTPFLLVQRPQQTVQQLLSPRSLQLVAHLLTRIRVLPLSLQAFTLRLSVQLGEEESAVLWARFDKHKVFDDIVFRVQNVTVDDRHRVGLIPAVNTVIYLALCEAAYPLRPSSPSDSNRTVSYWL